MRIVGQILLGYIYIYIFSAYQWMDTCEIRIVFYRLQNHSLLIFEQFYGKPTIDSHPSSFTWRIWEGRQLFHALHLIYLFIYIIIYNNDKNISFLLCLSAGSLHSATLLSSGSCWPGPVSGRYFLIDLQQLNRWWMDNNIVVTVVHT